MALQSDCILDFSPSHRLQWEESQQRTVILYPEGMVELNKSSAEILKLCDGTRTFDNIVSDLETLFSTTGLRNDISDFIEIALENGWIKKI